MIRHVGTNVVEAIIRCRKEKGAYGDFYDFLRRVDAVACNKKTIESLIKAGAFDSMGHTRKGLLAVHADGDRLAEQVPPATARARTTVAERGGGTPALPGVRA